MGRPRLQLRVSAAPLNRPFEHEHTRTIMLSANAPFSFSLSAFLMRRVLPVAITLYLWLGLVSALQLTHLTY